MHKPVLIVLAVAVGTAAIISALIWTFGLKPIQGNTITAKITEPDTPPINEKIYGAATPVMGTIEKRLEIKPEYNENGVFALVDSKAVINLRHSPNVIFFKPNGMPYASMGSIKTSASDTKVPGKTRVTLSVADQILRQQPAKAALILSRNPLAKRLPLEALHKDPETQKSSIWLLNPNVDNSTLGTVSKRNIIIKQKDDEFFDVGRNIRITQLVILNPDPNLQDGQTIGFRIEPIKVSTSNDRYEALYQEANDGKFCEPHNATSTCSPGTACHACAP